MIATINRTNPLSPSKNFDVRTFPQPTFKSNKLNQEESYDFSCDIDTPPTKIPYQEAKSFSEEDEKFLGHIGEVVGTGSMVYVFYKLLDKCHQSLSKKLTFVGQKIGGKLKRLDNSLLQHASGESGILHRIGSHYARVKYFTQKHWPLKRLTKYISKNKTKLAHYIGKTIRATILLSLSVSGAMFAMTNILKSGAVGEKSDAY